MNITELYCDVDDFCPIFLSVWQNSLLPSPKTSTSIHPVPG